MGCSHVAISHSTPRSLIHTQLSLLLNTKHPVPFSSDHLYWTFYILINQQGLFSYDTANRAFREAPRGTYEDGVAPPPLPAVMLVRDKRGKLPGLKKGGKFRLTAYNSMKIAKARCDPLSGPPALFRPPRFVHARSVSHTPFHTH